MNFFNRKNGTDVLDREGFDARPPPSRTSPATTPSTRPTAASASRARHAMVTTVRGAFTDFDGTAHHRHREPRRLQRRADHRRRQRRHRQSPTATATCSSADFFDVESHPEMTFASTDVERDGNEWTITGDLTIKGVAKPVTVVFETDRLGPRPLRQPARRLRGRRHDQPQGLGPHLERRARDRRRPRLREDQARRSTSPRSATPDRTCSQPGRGRPIRKWGGPVGDFALDYGPCPHRSPCPTASSSAP